MAGSVQSIRSFPVNSELFVRNFKEEVHEEGSAEVPTRTVCAQLHRTFAASFCNLDEAWGPQPFMKAERS